MKSNLEVAIEYYEHELGEYVSKELFWDAVAENTIEDAEKEGRDYLEHLDLVYVNKLVEKYKDKFAIK